MSQKKKKVILISCIAAVLASATIGAFIWFSNSPFATAIKMMSAIKDHNFDAVLEYIEPETAKKIELLMLFTGMSFDDFASRLTPDGAETGNGSLSDTSVKFSGYDREGDEAWITLNITTSDHTEFTQNIYFVRISGTWYLSIKAIFE